jgi:1-acyl-sn-glycerol-3-phosphate acyltransferase
VVNTYNAGNRPAALSPPVRTTSVAKLRIDDPWGGTMSESKACEAAKRKYGLASYRVELVSLSFLFASLAPSTPKSRKSLKAVRKRLAEAQKQMNQAIDALLEACGERVVFVETNPGPPREGFKLHIHPRVSASDEKKVTEILGGLPRKHKKGIAGIWLRGKPKAKPKKRKGRPFVTTGDYNAKTKKINDYYPPNPHTIKHEVGHHVYYQKLTKAMRAEWERWWKQHKKQMPTGYAQTRAREGWAEVYEFVYDNKSLDAAVKAKFQQLVGAIP